MNDEIAIAVAEIRALARGEREKAILRKRQVRRILWSMGAQPVAVFGAAEQLISAINLYEAHRSIEVDERDFIAEEVRELTKARNLLVGSIRHIRKFREKNAERHRLYSGGMGRDAWRESGRTHALSRALVELDKELRARAGKRGRRTDRNRNDLWIDFLDVYRSVFNAEAKISNVQRPWGSTVIYVSEGRFVAYVRDLSRLIENEPTPTGDAIAGVLGKVQTWERENSEVWNPRKDEESQAEFVARNEDALTWLTGLG